MKEELELFLSKKIKKEMDVLEEKIHQADGNVKDSIDVEEYQRLVCSFRPLLITNSSNLAHEYQSLAETGPVGIPRSSKIQQNRYAELTKLEHKISAMHNEVFLDKSDARLLTSYEAITNFF